MDITFCAVCAAICAAATLALLDTMGAMVPVYASLAIGLIWGVVFGTLARLGR
jgi:hypothetical protein